MKKITTIFKTMLLVAVVLAMAQGCIPTTPIGGNPTPVDTTKGSLQIGIRKFTNVISLPENLTGTFTFEFYKRYTNELITTATETYTLPYPLEFKTYNSVAPGEYYIKVKQNGIYLGMFNGSVITQNYDFEISAEQQTQLTLYIK